MAKNPIPNPIPPRTGTGILLINLGTPDQPTPASVRRYLAEFLSDLRVVEIPRIAWQPVLRGIILPIRGRKSAALYQTIWDKEKNDSPLRAYTKGLADRLYKKLGPDIQVDYAMRYGNPPIEQRLRHLVDQGCEHIIVLPLYPQFCAATVATAMDVIYRCCLKWRWPPTIIQIPPYFDHPDYVQSIVESIRADLPEDSEALLYSFHGMPVRTYRKGDPYHDQALVSFDLIKERLRRPDLPQYLAFQSRFGPEQWLKPYASEEVVRLANEGIKKLAVIAPGFSCDCIETLEEIALGLEETFIEAGGEKLTYIPCLNDSDWAESLYLSLIERYL